MLKLNDKAKFMLAGATLLVTSSVFAAADIGGPNAATLEGSAAPAIVDVKVASVSVIASAVTNPLLIEPIVPLKPAHVAHSQAIRPSRFAENTWIILSVSQHSAALFDAWSTRQVLSSGKGYERDPLLRPFANSSAIYPATQLVPLALDLVGHRLMKRENRYLRYGWWVPQLASIAGSLWCGSRNLRVANRNMNDFSKQ